MSLSPALFSLTSKQSKIHAAVNAFKKLAADYEKQLFVYDPITGTVWGKSDIDHSKFTDHSFAAVQAWQKKEDAFLQALNEIDEIAMRDTSEYYAYLHMKQTLENKINGRICRSELWDLNPFFGWHNRMTFIAAKQPIGTPELRQQALKRWSTFGDSLENQLDNLKMGMQLGYTAPKVGVERVLIQLNLMLTSKVEDSPFYDFAKRDSSPAFKKEVATIVETVINPALKKYIDFLKYGYLPLVRSEISVSYLPSGLRGYQARIKEDTTLSISPQEIHQLGLDYLERLSKEISKIGWKYFQTKNVKEIFLAARARSVGYFTSEQDILNYNVFALERVKHIVDRWFKDIPKADGIVKPYPLHRAQAGAAGEYHPPSEDSKNPGIYFINTFEPKKRSRVDMEATLFHELIPGHHYQVALSYENKSIPSINKYLWNSGYGEGWALYVERLADEMGVYHDDISRLGMLSNESWRAARLVIDTGIHAMNWTRQQAVEYLEQHTALDPNILQSEIDRYIMWPGQATSYMLGKLEIEQLRSYAMQTLGERFDLREFHSQVIRHGNVTLPILKMVIYDWISQKNKQELDAKPTATMLSYT